ncbi:MAG: YbaB/EbfC family nucleoid-associated protein [Chloroflexi bacterium]|nr:YbaB/EbfC family nucleoid-associated protein [Chloroflexota bacterium]
MNRQFRRRQGRAAGGGNQSQAQQMQAQLQKIQELQDELETMTAEGTAGGGVVKVVMTGKQTIESVEIDPEALEDVELLQDLVAAAFNDAISKTQELAAAKMGSITGGLNIPGLT